MHIMDPTSMIPDNSCNLSGCYMLDLNTYLSYTAGGAAIENINGKIGGGYIALDSLVLCMTR